MSTCTDRTKRGVLVRFPGAPADRRASPAMPADIARLPPAVRHTLAIMLGGPLHQQPRGWCRQRSHLPVCADRTVEAL